MKTKQVIERARSFAKPFRVADGSRFSLKDIDPGNTLDLGTEDRPRAKEALATGVEALAELQDMLYAQDRWAVLLVFQAMDAAGKDGTIKHVMSGVNPQGCQVYSFKAPSAEDLNHDFLWRCMKYVPERAEMGPRPSASRPVKVLCSTAEAKLTEFSLGPFLTFAAFAASQLPSMYAIVKCRGQSNDQRRKDRYALH